MEISLSQKESNLKKIANSDGVDRVKILLVDDLKDNLLALEALLRRDDIEIFKAKSGTEALELMISHEYAVALIDVQMPGMNGFELAELMRGTKQTRNIPIIFVTAAKDQSFSFKGYESGAVDFLPKPLDTHAVKSKVNVFIELYRQKKELELLLTELKKTKAELEDALQARDEFLSIASHELRTPLTSLSLQVQLLIRSTAQSDSTKVNLALAPEKILGLMHGCDNQTRKLTRLLDELLDLTKIRVGKFKLNKESVELNSVVRDMINQKMAEAALKGGTISCTASTSIVGNWDSIRLEQIISNLLSNAIKYGEGKPIEVITEFDSAKNTAKLIVKDHGMGISKEMQSKIFERFERVAVDQKITGLGLGLYIVRKIVDGHGGAIHVESAVGRGSIFIVELPLSGGND